MSDHSGQISALNVYVKHLDQARAELISALNAEGFIIPTDEMRESQGAEHIKLCEIPNWLYTLNEALLVCKTTKIKSIKILKTIYIKIPDLQVIWDYNGDPKKSDFEYISSAFYDDKGEEISGKTYFSHEWAQSTNHTFALYSKSKLDKISDTAFNTNLDVLSVKLTPVLNQIGQKAFFQANNLEYVDIGTNVTDIYSNAFSYSKVKDFTIPKSVTNIYGVDTFYSSNEYGINSFKFEENSNLENLYYYWIFNFRDQPAYNTKYIDIPSGCKFYPDKIGGKFYQLSNDTYENMSKYENVAQIIKWYNPFSRAFNHFNFGTSDEDVLSSDEYGVIYMVAKDKRPIILMNVAQDAHIGLNNQGKEEIYWDDNLKNYIIPNTVKYITKGAFMNLRCLSAEPIKIPSNIEYIYPIFMYWSGHKNIKYKTISNEHYKSTQYGGLMTKSNLNNSDFDVLLYEGNPTDSEGKDLEEYHFPDTFTSSRDFHGNRIHFSTLINSHSNIKRIYINDKLPKISEGYGSSNNLFTGMPKSGFRYENNISSINYTLDNVFTDSDGEQSYRSMYQKEDENGNINNYHTLVWVQKGINLKNNDFSFNINKNTKFLGDHALYGCRLKQGELDLTNIENGQCYMEFSYLKFYDQSGELRNDGVIKFGDNLHTIGGHRTFSGSNVRTIYLGRTKESNLTCFYGNLHFYNCTNDIDVYIPGLNLKIVGEGFLSQLANGCKCNIHVDFRSDTFKLFNDYLKIPTTDYYSGYKLIDIPPSITAVY